MYTEVAVANSLAGDDDDDDDDDSDGDGDGDDTIPHLCAVTRGINCPAELACRLRR